MGLHLLLCFCNIGSRKLGVWTWVPCLGQQYASERAMKSMARWHADRAMPPNRVG